MGTRHMITVIQDNQKKIIQYGQWDGDPNYTGIRILKFLREEFNREQFEKNLMQLSFLNESEFRQRWIEVGADENSDTVSIEISENFKKVYPEDHRDTGYKILSIVQNAKNPLKLVDGRDYLKDNLYELDWEYIIDLNYNVFEVFNGDKPKVIDSKRIREVFKLDNLPTEEQFLSTFY